MARKFELSPGKYVWYLDWCEEILVITAYNEIARFIAPGQAIWSHDFERFFYEKGAPLGFYLIDRINDVRKRKNLKTLTFRETDVSEYGRIGDRAERAKARRALRDQITELDPKGVAAMIEKATIATDALPPPHFTYEEWKANHERQKSESQASRAAVTLRLAQQRADEYRAASEIRMARTMKMLSLVTDKALLDTIIASLNPDEALGLAEQIEDPVLRNELVRYSISSLS
jgi:hypothetical protein